MNANKIGEFVHIMSESQNMRQNQLSELTGIPQSTLSAFRRVLVDLGVGYPKALTGALKCHLPYSCFPAVSHNHEHNPVFQRTCDRLN
jgi:hypothetical protein